MYKINVNKPISALVGLIIAGTFASCSTQGYMASNSKDKAKFESTPNYSFLDHGYYKTTAELNKDSTYQLNMEAIYKNDSGNGGESIDNSF